MKRRKRLIIVGLAFLIIFGISAVKMIKSPLLLVKVISIGDASVFNQKPDSEMDVNIKNTTFNYKFPVLLSKDKFKGLNKEIKTSDLELTKVIKICRWVREKLSFGDDSIHYYFWQPEVVLRDSRGKKFLCDGYARLSASVAQNFRIPSRVIWLSGHVVPEFYLSDLEKWVMVDPTHGYYLKSEKVVLSTTQIISSFEKEKMPKRVDFGDEVKNDEPASTLKGIIPVYTNKFTFAFSGENTEKGIRYSLFHELKFSRGLQYKESGSPNLEMQGKVMRILNIGSFLGIVLCLVFLIRKWKYQS